MLVHYGTTKTRSQRRIDLSRSEPRECSEDDDYIAFESVLAEAVARSGIRLLSGSQGI